MTDGSASVSSGGLIILFAWFWWLIYFAFMLFCIWTCASVAASKGRGPLLFGILGAFFTLITLVVVLVMPARQTA